MRFSTKGRYAIRFMVDLAENQKDGYVSLKDISARQGFSIKYLEQIVPLLTSANFLKASRGPKGGYRLRKNPEEYTVGEILEATEVTIAPVVCLETEDNDCERKANCKTLSMWTELYRIEKEYLYSVTIQDLISGGLE